MKGELPALPEAPRPTEPIGVEAEESKPHEQTRDRGILVWLYQLLCIQLFYRHGLDGSYGGMKHDFILHITPTEQS